MFKLKYYFKYMHWYSFKVIYYMLLQKVFHVNNTNKRIKVKSKKTGVNKLVIRPYTTDLKVVKQILINNGEYDFLYNPKYNTYRNAKVIIDAGANIGVFSRIISEICYDSVIVAIEPEKNNFDIMKSNLFENRFICLNSGLWNRKCNLEVQCNDYGEWGFTVKQTSKKEFSIPGIDINSIMKIYNFECIDILKIDIEGAEYNVFDESSDFWLDKVRLLIIELHDRKKRWCSLRVMEKMKNHNFDYDIYDETYVFYKEEKKRDFSNE